MEAQFLPDIIWDNIGIFYLLIPSIILLVTMVIMHPPERRSKLEIWALRHLRTKLSSRRNRDEKGSQTRMPV